MTKPATRVGDTATDRSKTVAAWLALTVGAFGAHLFYLRGIRDRRAWLLWLPTLAGAYGAMRMRRFGVDDTLAGLLLPLLGLTLAGTMLTAIVYALMADEAWNARHNRGGSGRSLAGFNVLGAVLALALGATALMASLAFAAQQYFDHQKTAPALGADEKKTPLN